MEVIYKGKTVEASELRSPDGDKVVGYQIGNEIVMPQEVQIPGEEPATVELPETHFKAKRGKDSTIT